jgi:hypothetical protein
MNIPFFPRQKESVTCYFTAGTIFIRIFSANICMDRAKSLLKVALHSNKKYYFCNNLGEGMPQYKDTPSI